MCAGNACLSISLCGLGHRIRGFKIFWLIGIASQTDYRSKLACWRGELDCLMLQREFYEVNLKAHDLIVKVDACLDVQRAQLV